MTFDEILNSTDARIKYLGGLAALAPHIPFPIDVIKEKLDEDKKLLQTGDKRIWDEAAGFLTDNLNVCTHRNKTNPIWDLYNSKNITSISCVDSTAILKEAARQIAALPEEEIDKLYPNRDKRYYVTIAVDSKVVIPVLAKNMKDAEKAATDAFIDVNLGEAEYIKHKVVHTKDIYGNATDN